MTELPSGRSAPRPRPYPLAMALGLLGGVAGAVAGHLAFRWLVSGMALYALAVPGVLVGMGCGVMSRQRSWLLAAISAVLAAAVCFYSEWRLFPFAANEGLGYFLRHLGDLTPLTKLNLAAAVLFGGWFGLGRPHRYER